MRAADVMTTDVVTVGPDARVVEVAETFLASRISAVPIIGERGELVGVVSEGDLMRRSEIGSALECLLFAVPLEPEDAGFLCVHFQPKGERREDGHRGMSSLLRPAERTLN